MLTQPTVQGFFSTPPPPYPDASWAIHRYPGYPVYGLYSYVDPWRRHRQDIKDVGWSHLRLGGPITKADMQDIAADGLGASIHLADGTKRGSYATDEAFIADALKRVAVRLDRYPDLKYAHVWNEPNGGYMYEVASLLEKADLYGKLLIQVGALVREKRPEIKILGFDAARPGKNAVEFTQLVYERHPEVHQAYDIYALHPGIDPAPPESKPRYFWGDDYSIAETVRDIRSTFRIQPGKLRAKPIWFTEAGWDIGEALGVSPLLQAAYVCRGYAQCLRLGVKRWTPFFVEDADGLSSGFFDGNEKRLSAQAVQTMIQIMPRPKLATVLRDGDDGVYAYQFDPDAESSDARRAVVMAWNVEGPKTIELDLGHWATFITNMMGETLPAASPSGRYTVDVGPLPVYLT